MSYRWVLPSTAVLLYLAGQVKAQTIVSDTAYYRIVPVGYRVNRSPSVNSYAISSVAREKAYWYGGITGLFRHDRSRLQGDPISLVSINPVNGWGWGGLLGYMNRGWAMEGGYMQSPIHAEITIANRAQPFVFRYQNGGQVLMGRVKRRLGNAGKPVGSAGWWFSAGAGLVVNARNYEQSFILQGVNYGRQRASADTIRLSGTTHTANLVSGLMELGIGYTTPVHKRIMLDTFVRRYWGVGRALHSTLVYTSTHGATQTAQVTANGEGWSIGLGLYYRYATRHQLVNR